MNRKKEKIEIRFKLAEPAYEDLQLYTQYSGRTVSEVVREAVETWIIKRTKELKKLLKWRGEVHE